METVVYKLFGFIPIITVRRKIQLDDEIVKKLTENVKQSITTEINTALKRVRG